MKGKRYSPEQIVKILREAEKADSAREVIRRYDVTEQTFYRWKKVYAGMGVPDIKKLKAVQEENLRLKRLVADQALKISLLEDVNSKKW
jgi:putative transposase